MGLRSKLYSTTRTCMACSMGQYHRNPLSEWCKKGSITSQKLPLLQIFGLSKPIREPTSGLEPLTPAPATSVRSVVAEGCTGLQIPHI
jgi:hypothetical protein